MRKLTRTEVLDIINGTRANLDSLEKIVKEQGCEAYPIEKTWYNTSLLNEIEIQVQQLQQNVKSKAG